MSYIASQKIKGVTVVGDVAASPVLAVITAVRLLIGMTKLDVVSQRGW